MNWINIRRALLGTLILAVGVNFVVSLNMGIASLQMMALVIMSLTPIAKFGNGIFVIHIFFFMLLVVFQSKFRVDIKQLSMSLLSVFITTRVINLLDFINAPQGVEGVAKLIIFLIAVVITNSGVYLMLRSNIMTAPSDRFVIQIANINNYQLGHVRWVFDLVTLGLACILTISLALPVPITIYTVIIILSIGPQITLMDKVFKLDRK